MKHRKHSLANTVLSLILCIGLMLNGTVTLDVLASNEVTAGNFQITGGTSGTDFTYADGVLTVKTSAALVIKDNAEKHTDRIKVASGVSANITLSEISIDVTSVNACAIDFSQAEASTLTLEAGTLNFAVSGENCPGVFVPDGKLLTINGTGALYATGGLNWPGIGRSGNSNILFNGATVEATGGKNAAGIGGSNGFNGGNITIQSGDVTGTAGENGAGIGGGLNAGTGENITINGGTVKATGGKYGAGIGGGMYGTDGGTIRISGGSVTSNGGEGGAGVGGGYKSLGGNITITNGVINSCGGELGAGIGGGAHGENGGVINISGGAISATGGSGGAGIGGGYGGTAGTLTVNGGRIKATGPASEGDPAGMGGGAFAECGTVIIHNGYVEANGSQKGIGSGANKSGGTILIDGGTVYANGIGTGGYGSAASTTILGGVVVCTDTQFGGINTANQGSWKGLIINGTTGQVYGNATLTEGLVNTGTLTVPTGTTLTIAPGVTLTNNGTIANNGSVVNNGAIVNGGNITGNGIGGSITNGISYLTCDKNGQNWTSAVKSTGTYSQLTNTNTLGALGTTTWYLLNSNVDISDRIKILGNVHIILMDHCTLNAWTGISVTRGNNLTIYAQSTDGATMGSISGRGYNYNAGIGADRDSPAEMAFSGDITINGGNIYASGGDMAAGIGGGPRGSGSVITINGGIVTAESHSSYGGEPAAIGSGSFYEQACDVIINGGKVSAIGSNGNGLGHGDNVTISGGEVTTNGIGNKTSGFTKLNGGMLICTGQINRPSDQNEWKGLLFAGNTGRVYGDYTLKQNLELTSEKKLEILDGAKLVIDSGVTLTNDGTINIASTGALVNSGTIENRATLTNNGQFSCGGILNNSKTMNNTGTLTIGGVFTHTDTLMNSGTINGNGRMVVEGVFYDKGKLGTDLKMTYGSVHIPYDKVLSIPTDYTLYINEGQTITADGKVENNGTITGGGALINHGDFENNGAITGNVSVSLNHAVLGNGTYVDENLHFNSILEVPAGKTFTIPAGQTFTVPAGVALINYGTVLVVGTLVINGSVQNKGSFVNCGTVTGNGITGNATTEAVDVTSDSTALGTSGQESYYEVKGDVTISDRITVSGNVILLLTDGCTLNASNGIAVLSGNSLTIYARSKEKDVMGKINANGNNGNAAIGGNFRADAGTITIDGGVINATSVGYEGDPSAIGGGAFNSAGTININGGYVTATGSKGISCGGWCYAGAIYIRGGVVVASGIGNRTTSTDSSVATQIIGGTVISSSDINKDYQSSWCGLVFEKSVGKIYDKTDATLEADISIPKNGSLTIDKGQTLTIPENYTLSNNGAINCNGTINLDGILIHSGEITGSGTINNNGFLFGGGTVEDSIRVTPAGKNTEIPEGVVLTIPSGTTLVIPEGETFINNGTIINNGILDVEGALTQNGVLEQNGLYKHKGYFELSTKDELFRFMDLVNSGENTANARLMASIDIGTSQKIIDTGNRYGGIFDGNGYSIAMQYHFDWSGYSLFYTTDGATIRNLTITGVYETDKNPVGGIAGWTKNTLIENCVSYATVKGRSTTVSIIACDEGNTTIKNCFYLSNTETADGGRTAEQFKSAEMSWLLNTSGGTEKNSLMWATGENYPIKADDTHGATVRAHIDVTGRNEYHYLSAGDSIAFISDLIHPGSHTDGKVISDDMEITLNKTSKKDPTCLEEGYEEYWTCSVCGKKFSDAEGNNFISNPIVIEKLSHVYGDWIEEIPATENAHGMSGHYECQNCHHYFNKLGNDLKSLITGHQYNERGFCRLCGAYQPCEENDNGYYEIDNAGRLMWFSALTNGSLPDIWNAVNKAKGILTTDIDLNSGYTFVFIPDTGLVKVSGNGETFYLGAGKRGDTSGSDTAFDTDSSVRGRIYTLSNGVYTENSAADDNLCVWTPIGNGGNGAPSYAGIFDGAGHSVSGMYINNGLSYEGFIGYLQVGSVKGLTTKNSYICGINVIGGIVGFSALIASVKDCTNEGTVVGQGWTGGIAGQIHGSNKIGTHKGLVNHGAICGFAYTGGIAGSAGSIANSYNTGIVYSSGHTVGGIGGSISDRAELCFNSGVVTSQFYKGEIQSNALTESYFCESLVGSEERLASGEITWLLNGSVSVDSEKNATFVAGATDGTQSFYQTIGSDDYPKFTGKTVYYVVKANCGGTPASPEQMIYSNTVLPPHTLTKVSLKEPTCLENGYKEHYKCSVCNKVFTDSEGKNEISEPIAIEKLSHIYGEWIEAVPGNSTSHGSVGHFECASCHHYFDTEKNELKSIITNHIYNSEGFCKMCGDYQPAVKNENGYYTINNAGKLMWFAALTNGTLSDSTEKDVNAKCVLTENIDLNPGYTFTFEADTGLEMITGNGKTFYLGTGLAGDTSKSDTSFDSEASKKGEVYTYSNGVYTVDETADDDLLLWLPVGSKQEVSFAGTIDGAGHSISGLYTNRDSFYTGVVGYMQVGTVKDLTLKNSYVRGTSMTGGIVGFSALITKVKNCANEATVVGDAWVGGVVGSIHDSNKMGTHTGFINSGTISGTAYVGGIVGLAGYVSNAYNSGRVYASSYTAGGIGGNVSEGIELCFNSGVVSSPNFSGEIQSNKPQISYFCESVRGSEERLGSGEITWLLNGSVNVDSDGNASFVAGATDGTQSFYQTLGTDSYPKFSGKTVYFDDNAAPKYFNDANEQTVSVNVAYNANGGSGNMASVKVTSGESYTLPSCEFTAPSGKQFKEWAIGSLSGSTVSAGGTYKFTANTSVYAVWENISSKPTAGNGTAESPYEIAAVAELYWFKNVVNNGETDLHAKLTADINLNPGVTFEFDEDTGLVKVTKDGETPIAAFLGTGINGVSGENEIFDTAASVAGAWYSTKDSAQTTDSPFASDLIEWLPIGTSNNRFEGSFDGNSKTVSGVYINDSVVSYSGLFGIIDGGTVNGLTVNNGYVCGKKYAGGICAYNISGNITACANGLTVIVNSNGGRTGGVCGANSSGNIENAVNTGTVSANGNSVNIGGICGYNENSSSSVKNSFNSGLISANGTSVNIGAVSGKNNGVAENCYYKTGSAASGIGSGTGDEVALGKNADELASGKVAWLLQNSVAPDEQTGVAPLVWGQSDLRTDGSVPMPTSNEQNRVILFGENNAEKYLSKAELFDRSAIIKTCVGKTVDKGGLDIANADVLYRADLNSDGVIDVLDAMIIDLVAAGHKTK